MLSNLFFQQPPFGLDISDLSLKIAQLEKHQDEMVLISYGRKEIPQGIIEKGVIKKEEELIKIFKEAVNQLKGRPLRTKNCIVSLPETEAFIKIVQLPLMKKQEIEEAIKWEAEANIPLPIEEVYLDWQIIEPIIPPKKQNYYDILIGALPKKLVDSYLETLKKSDLRPLVFEIESIATSRALIEKNFSTKPLMIIDLGAQRTSFIIFSGPTIHFTASLPIGNNSLIEAIVKNLNINKKKAKELKFKVGLDKTKENGRVFQALEPQLKELCQKAMEYISYFQAHCLPGYALEEEISKIILCGGGANLIGLPLFISSELKIETEIGNPWINILKPNFKELPELPYKESITFSTALGLALRGIDLTFNG